MKFLVMGLVNATLPLIGAGSSAQRLEQMLREERVFEGVAEIRSVQCAAELGCRIHLSKQPGKYSVDLRAPLEEFARRHAYEFGRHVRTKPGTERTPESIVSISG